MALFVEGELLDTTSAAHGRALVLARNQRYYGTNRMSKKMTSFPHYRGKGGGNTECYDRSTVVSAASVL